MRPGQRGVSTLVAAWAALALALAGCGREAPPSARPSPSPDPAPAAPAVSASPSPLAPTTAAIPAATRPPSPSGSAARPAPAPAPPVAPPSFAPVGDVVRFAAVGDTGTPTPGLARVVDEILAAHREDSVDLLLLLGDLIYPRGDPAGYPTAFAQPFAPVTAAAIPTVATLGNHDIQTDTGGFLRAFGMPGRYFTVVRGPVEFFVLDTSRAVVDAPQLAWLEGALAASASPWKVAVMHVPLFSAGQLHGSHPALQQVLQPLFERHGVQLVLAGHEHNYQRMVPVNGVTYVVSGAGCCPRPVGRSAMTAAVADGLSFVVVDVGADVLRLTARAPGGVVLDTAEVARRPAMVP